MARRPRHFRLQPGARRLPMTSRRPAVAAGSRARGRPGRRLPLGATPVFTLARGTQAAPSPAAAALLPGGHGAWAVGGSSRRPGPGSARLRERLAGLRRGSWGTGRLWTQWGRRQRPEPGPGEGPGRAGEAQPRASAGLIQNRFLLRGRADRAGLPPALSSRPGGCPFSPGAGERWRCPELPATLGSAGPEPRPHFRPGWSSLAHGSRQAPGEPAPPSLATLWGC